MFNWFETRINLFSEEQPQQPPSSFFSFIWFCTKGLRGYLFLLATLTAATAAFEAMLFSMLGSVVDILGKSSVLTFWQDQKFYLITLAVILILSPFLIGAQALLNYQTLFSTFPMKLRWNFHRHLLRQSLPFFQDEFAGRVSTKLMQTALAVRDTVISVTDILVFVSVYFITMVAIVGALDFKLMLPFLGWLSLYILMLIYFVPKLGKISEKQADARSLMTGRITDAYTNISTVKLFSHSNRESLYAKDAMQSFMHTAFSQMRLVTQFEVMNHALSMLLIIATTIMTLWLWSINQVGLGAVAAAVAMALRLNGISHWIMWEMSSLFENIGTVQDGLSTLSKPVTITDTASAEPIQISKGQIEFRNLNFSYGTQKNILQNLNLTIKAGEKIGLVGRSGAGKSTLINLLLRFYEPQQGQILIDNQDIQLVQQESLRAQIGMVTQDTSLLHRTIKENILYGKPFAQDEEMIYAAKQASAHDFIMLLSDNKGNTDYNTLVGERGVKLSGGQRQRIAISRVILKNAPILLLDEATSALDSEVEMAIQESLDRLMDNKTVIAIAHRLSTIAAMDRLIVMDNGTIVEQGTHQELLLQNGIYAKLWEHQSGGFLGED